MQTETRFGDILNQAPNIQGFLKDQTILGEPVRRPSRWRSNNDIFAFETDSGLFILKRINQPNSQAEIDYQQLLAQTYPGFVPRIHAHDGSTLIMEFFHGDDLLTTMRRPFQETSPLLESASVHLEGIYTPLEGSLRESSAPDQLLYTYKYQAFDPKRDPARFDRALCKWEGTLECYPAQYIHNDLNSANTIITPDGQVRSIDPRADVYGLKDVAKDLGRLLAAGSCAAHSNGYTEQQTLAILETISRPWRERNSGLPERTTFYVGQSYLSFSRWDTETLAKEGLFEVGVSLLEQGPTHYATFSHLAEEVTQALVTKAYVREDL